MSKWRIISLENAHADFEGNDEAQTKNRKRYYELNLWQ